MLATRDGHDDALVVAFLVIRDFAAQDLRE